MHFVIVFNKQTWWWWWWGDSNLIIFNNNNNNNNNQYSFLWGFKNLKNNNNNNKPVPIGRHWSMSVRGTIPFTSAIWSSSPFHSVSVGRTMVKGRSVVRQFLFTGRMRPVHISRAVCVTWARRFPQDRKITSTINSFQYQHVIGKAGPNPTDPYSISKTVECQLHFIPQTGTGQDTVVYSP